MFVLNVLKSRSPGIGTVLHWRPLDIHIFHTDPSLVHLMYCSVYYSYTLKPEL